MGKIIFTLAAIIALFLNTTMASTETWSLSITTDKNLYCIYEPVMVTIIPTIKVSDENISFDLLGCHRTSFHLQIIKPDGAIIEYKPFVTFEKVSQGLSPELIYETVIISNGDVITKMPGRFLFQLFDNTTNLPISNEAQIETQLPLTSDDQKAVEVIQSNTVSYGLFLYLNGGDHIKYGLEIFTKLASFNSSFSPLACAILAMNYSQTFYTFMASGNEIRKKDLAIVRSYLYSSAFEKSHPALQLETANLIYDRFKNNGLDADITNKISGILESHKNTSYIRSVVYKKLYSSMQ